MLATIQYQSGRKPYPWVNHLRGTVLYADKNVIFVRTAGGHSVFQPDGVLISGNWRADKRPPRSHRWYRIHPRSLERIHDATI